MRLGRVFGYGALGVVALPIWFAFLTPFSLTLYLEALVLNELSLFFVALALSASGFLLRLAWELRATTKARIHMVSEFLNKYGITSLRMVSATHVVTERGADVLFREHGKRVDDMVRVFFCETNLEHGEDEPGGFHAFTGYGTPTHIFLFDDPAEYPPGSWFAVLHEVGHGTSSTSGSAMISRSAIVSFVFCAVFIVIYVPAPGAVFCVLVMAWLYCKERKAEKLAEEIGADEFAAQCMGPRLCDRRIIHIAETWMNHTDKAYNERGRFLLRSIEAQSKGELLPTHVNPMTFSGMKYVGYALLCLTIPPTQITPFSWWMLLALLSPLPLFVFYSIRELILLRRIERQIMQLIAE